MAKVNSRAKGARSELEARDLLRRCGIHDAERGARNGVKSGADIHSPTLERLGWRVEVKNVAAMRLGNKLWSKACIQAICDAPGQFKWFVLWRPCRGAWAVSTFDERGYVISVVGEESIKPWIEANVLKGEQHGEA